MQPRKRRRGFALLIVMVLAVAMVAAATALTLSSGQQEIAGSYAEGTELARVIAESGLARAEAWAIQNLKDTGDVDFDRVLDPSLAADCTGLGGAPFSLSTSGTAPRAGATTFVPPFTDSTASVIDFPSGSGKKWRRVTLDKGAYLVRYEDNSDDGMTPAGDWSARTGNNVGTACNEGPTQGDNPARDRDATIWANVIGIYPGTNPETAVNRVLLRKMIRKPSGAPGQPAFRVGGNVGSDVSASNNLASVEVGGNVTSTSGFCGKLSVGGTSTAGANTSCSPSPNPFINAPGATVAFSGVPGPQSSTWYDWATPCNFYVKPGVGLFFWDSTASRGGAACSSYTGDLVSPNPDVTLPPSGGSCWTPIILLGTPTPSTNSYPGNVAIPYEPFETTSPARDNIHHDGFFPTCAAFDPSSASSTTYVDPGSGYSVGSYTANGGAAQVSYKSWFTPSTASAAQRTVTLPNFANCSVSGSASELRWPSAFTTTTPAMVTQPTTFPRVTCTGGSGATCNGGTSTLLICPSSADADGAVQFLDNAGAYVTGVVYKEGNYAQTRGFSTTPEPTSVSGARTNWPMFTFIVQGNFVMNVNDKLWLGVGTKKGNFPSLVVGGSLDASAATGTAKLKLLGGLYVGGNVSMKKSLVMYGPVSIAGNVEALSGGSVVWDYDYDYFGTGAPAAAAPEPIVTFPVSF